MSRHRKQRKNKRARQIAAMVDANWHPEQVAALFDVSRSTVYSAMAAYGVKSYPKKRRPLQEKERRDA